MSGIYNYLVGRTYNFEPTDLLRHQKFLMLKQINNHKIKLRDTKEAQRLIDEREASFVKLIRERKELKKKLMIQPKQMKQTKKQGLILFS